jgi:hypothetical protein
VNEITRETGHDSLATSYSRTWYERTLTDDTLVVDSQLLFQKVPGMQSLRRKVVGLHIQLVKETSLTLR